EAFEEALELSPGDPGIAYAIAHCTAARGRWLRALVRALEAYHFAEDLADQAEFLRVAALGASELGDPELALTMCLGALDRAPNNPWVLETIGHFYEAEQMWLEALDVREALIDILADGIAPVPERTPETLNNPQFHRVFQSFAIKYRIDPEAIEARKREITERLRAEIGPADCRPDRRAGDEEAPLTPLNLPRGLSTLVEQLAGHDRNYQLLKSAQSLWAKARHDRLDLELPPKTLAAAIQWAVERRHWRIPTPLHALSQIYQVVPETIRAAARLVVGKFAVAYIALDDVRGEVGPTDWQRFETVQKAILYGAPIEDVRPNAPMLGE
ncbi:MAG: tetratricopeptide repeat protein, partial [Bradymonadaceae bacterium]